MQATKTEKMFKFLPDAKTVTLDSETNEEKSRKSSELKITSLQSRIVEVVNSTHLGLFDLRHLKVSELTKLDDPTISNLLADSSDLISGVYEGGLKLWECTVDLLKYLESNYSWNTKPPQVLDLGCGHGLLGIYALSKGASSVTFQDYNHEVLNFVTMPNVIINQNGKKWLEITRFFDGDWKYFRKMISLENLKFELILSSETIYNLNCLQDFVQLIETCLSPSGALFVAAKTFYFGVGGGTNAFVKEISKSSLFDIHTVQIIKKGVQREILKITWKKP